MSVEGRSLSAHQRAMYDSYIESCRVAVDEGDDRIIHHLKMLADYLSTLVALVAIRKQEGHAIGTVAHWDLTFIADVSCASLTVALEQSKTLPHQALAVNAVRAASGLVDELSVYNGLPGPLEDALTVLSDVCTQLLQIVERTVTGSCQAGIVESELNKLARLILDALRGSDEGL